MNSHLPNGHLANRFLIEEGFRAVSRGFRLDLPNLTHASAQQKNAFKGQIIQLLSVALTRGFRMQIQFYADSEFEETFGHYETETLTIPNAWVARRRNEKLRSFWEMKNQGKLLRHQCLIYIRRQVDAQPSLMMSQRKLKVFYTNLLEQLDKEFAQIGDRLETILCAHHGARTRAMDDQEHFLELHRFLNPSQIKSDSLLNAFNPRASVQEDCFHSEGVGDRQSGTFYLDGFHHAILVISVWPEATYPGISDPLTCLPFREVSVSVNIEPLDKGPLIKGLEKRIARLQADFTSEGHESILTVIEQTRRRIHSLMSGSTRPYSVQYIIRVWDRHLDGLQEKCGMVKVAINGMGAQCFRPTLPTSMKRVFAQSWPGFLAGDYRHLDLYAEGDYLVDLLPLKGNGNEDLNESQALYMGDQNNLTGLKLHEKRRPIHTAIFGTTGSGKSLLTIDIFTQLFAALGFIVLIDNGGSYNWITRLLCPGSRSVVFSPDGIFTINPLDTNRLVLSAHHLAMICALLTMMAGRCDDPERVAIRQAFFSKYVSLLYDDAFEDWKQKQDFQTQQDLARQALAIETLRQRMPEGTSTLDAFIEFRDWSAANADQVAEFLAEFSDDDVLRFMTDPITSKAVRDLAFSRFLPEEFPTLTGLVELMQWSAIKEDRELASLLATLIRPWCRPQNSLFDGVTNLRLGEHRVVTIELGAIQKGSEALLLAASFVITEFIQRHIHHLPRATKKLMVFDEAARFLQIPGADLIMAEAYRQYRKQNTCVLSILTDFEPLADNAVGSAVLNSVSQFLILGHNSAKSLDELGDAIGLSSFAREAVKRFALPDRQITSRKFSQVLAHRTDGPRPLTSSFWYSADPEELYVGSTAGEDVERREAELKNLDDSELIEAVIRNANKSTR